MHDTLNMCQIKHEAMAREIVGVTRYRRTCPRYEFPSSAMPCSLRCDKRARISRSAVQKKRLHSYSFTISADELIHFQSKASINFPAKNVVVSINDDN